MIDLLKSKENHAIRIHLMCLATPTDDERVTYHSRRSTTGPPALGIGPLITIISHRCRIDLAEHVNISYILLVLDHPHLASGQVYSKRGIKIRFCALHRGCPSLRAHRRQALWRAGLTVTHAWRPLEDGPKHTGTW